jgi:hypothetical protein
VSFASLYPLKIDLSDAIQSLKSARNDLIEGLNGAPVRHAQGMAEDAPLRPGWPAENAPLN